jgi:hypothetical protein
VLFSYFFAKGISGMLRNFFLSLVVLGSFFLIGCAEGSGKGADEFNYDGSDFPPSPTGYIKSGDSKYEMEQGNYEWRRGGSVITTDHAGPTQIAETYNPLAVQPGEFLEIEVEQGPILTTYMWKDDSRTEMGKGNTLQMPEKTGRYIYEVIAEWDNGEVSYTFVVDIE